MAEQDDVYIGRTLLQSGRISRDDLLEALFDMANERRQTKGTARPLGVLLAARGRISRKEVNDLLAGRVGSTDESRLQQSTDLALGEILVASGAATPDQVQECLLAQERNGTGRRLGELLIDRGYCTSAQIQRALQYHDKTIYVCRKCRAQFNLVGAVPGHVYCCEECGAGLDVATGGSVAATDTGKRPAPAGTSAPADRPAAPPPPPVPSLPPDAQAHVDRAIYLYLKLKMAVRRETLKEAERFQIELSRYDLWVPIADILSRFGGLTWLQAEQIRKTDFRTIVESQAWKHQEVPGYKIVGRIASGGFATIFAAEPIFGGQRVALKVLHADRARTPAYVARFRHEAALLSRLHHPGIVRVFDFSEHGELYCLTMELVEGDSLDRIVCEGKGMNVLRALDVTRQVADALRYMQVEGYIHRDVKPENILVAPDGKAKLCDLGFATEIRPGAGGRSATTVGTEAFMSPEQARGETDLKVGTDIYALGQTLFFMLTAHARTGGRSSAELLTERLAGAMGEPDFSLMRAPEPVVALTRRMLHPDREQRYPAYLDLLKAIDECGVSLKPA
jgi:hypothetical protein